MSKTSFDYRHLNACRFPVKASYTPSGEDNCGAAVVAFGWWGENEDEGRYLCQEHLDFILQAEAQDA